MSTGFSPSIAIVVLGAIILVAAAIYFASVKRRKRDYPELTPMQKETVDKFDELVMALLNQHGESMTQMEIRNHLGLPAEVVAEKLLALEKEGAIERKWSNERYTFNVLAAAGREGKF